MLPRWVTPFAHVMKRQPPHRWMMVATAGLIVYSSVAQAASIHLKDNTVVTGDVLGTDDQYVAIRLPRGTIAAIDGHALPPPLVEGMAAPTFLVTDLLGQPQAVAPGSKKITILHFWVSWCPHCRSDAPKIQALHDQFRDNPRVQLVTVNLEQDRTKLEAFVQQHHVTYPIIFAAEQAAAPNGINLPDLYQISGFPVTFIIDDQGIIRHKTTGSFVEIRVDVASYVSALLTKSNAESGSHS